jgi:hypothetical protein
MSFHERALQVAPTPETNELTFSVFPVPRVVAKGALAIQAASSPCYMLILCTTWALMWICLIALGGRGISSMSPWLAKIISL